MEQNYVTKPTRAAGTPTTVGITVPYIELSLSLAYWTRSYVGCTGEGG